MTERLCLSENVWAVFDATEGPPWTFIDTVHTEDPDTAARQGCVRKWANGSHEILVVSMSEAHEFRISIETETVE